jgi:hypothetical protein
MDSYIFNIILITLFVVVLLHLYYNQTISIHHNTHNIKEDMNNMNLKNNVVNDCTLKKDKLSKIKNYDDGVYRDMGTYGLDRTNKSKRWYHVVNKLVLDDKRDMNELDILTKRTKKHTHNKNKKKYAHKNSMNPRKLVFGDNYDGIIESDFLDEKQDEILENVGNRLRHVDEFFVDVYGNICSSAETSQDVKKYLRENVLDGKSECGCVVDKSKSEFTRNEVNDYRESQLQFRDKIYGTSSPAVDPVDRLNLITIQEGIKAEGQTIANLYDNIISFH